MSRDFKPFFEQYEDLLYIADSVYDRIKDAYPDCVKCKIGCAGCCHALFDLTLIEALYINHRFNETLDGEAKGKLLDKAGQADRKIYKLKKDAYKDFESGQASENEILERMSRERIRCPLLNESDQCDLYEFRPITCRFYGIPTSIGGRGHTCGISGFVEGEKYPTVQLDQIHEKLYQISNELVQSIKTRYVKMADMLVPLSMALITVYDDDYLGISQPADAEQQKGE